MKSTFLSFLLLISCYNIKAQTSVSQFNPGITSDGVTYALPRTVLSFECSAMRIHYKPGRFAAYANRYLNLQNVEQAERTDYQLTNIQMRSIGVVDTTKLYTVKYKSKTTAPMVNLGEGGIILSINKSDMATSSVSFNSATTTTSRSNNRVDPSQYLTPEILSATSTAKMAELTAAEIYDIRESRNAIMRGQVESMPKDGESLRIMLTELERHETALMSLFIGEADTTDISYVKVYEPTTEVQHKVLFRFSKKLGFTDDDDLAGEPYYISIADRHTVSIPTPEQLAKRKITGIVYNLPGMANVEISTVNRQLLKQDVPLAQFGTTDQLPANLFNKETRTSVEFHPATGAIRQLQNTNNE